MDNGTGFADLESLFGRVDEVSAALAQAGAEREAGLTLLVERCQLLAERNQELALTARTFYDEARTIEGREQALAGQVEALTMQVQHLNEILARSMDSLGASHQRLASDNLMINQALRSTVPAESTELTLVARRPSPAQPTPFRQSFAPRPAPLASPVEDGDEGADIVAAAGGFSSLLAGRMAAVAAPAV